MMPIVQKVIIPVQLLLPDGSIRCPAGLRAVCLAARQHAVPVIGLCQYHNVSFAHPMVIYCQYLYDKVNKILTSNSINSYIEDVIIQNEVELGPSHNRDEIRPLWDSVKTNVSKLL